MYQTNIFVFICILVVQITPSLALDESNEQGRSRELHNLRKSQKLEDPKQDAIIEPGCICGVTGWHCCRKKRTLSKVRKNREKMNPKSILPL